MRIENNESTLEFFDKFRMESKKEEDLRDIYKNVDHKVITKEEEKLILRLAKDVEPDLKGFKRSSNSLLKNDYYKNIKLDDIKLDDIYYKTVNIPARVIWVANFPILKNAYGTFETTLGYYDRNVNIPMLMENNNVWMSITEMEINTSQFAIDKACGNVLTFGLGLGYFAYMCSLKESVNTVTIVEFNPKVIKIFKEYILPQFEYSNKIQIIQGDMYEFLNNDFLDKFDYKFADVWKSDEDGFNHYLKILKTNCDLYNFDFWIEDAIVRPIVKCLGLYFASSISNTVESVLNKRHSLDKEMSNNLLKIDKYFSNINEVLKTKEEIEIMMIDRKLIRNILRG